MSDIAVAVIFAAIFGGLTGFVIVRTLRIRRSFQAIGEQVDRLQETGDAAAKAALGLAELGLIMLKLADETVAFAAAAMIGLAAYDESAPEGKRMDEALAALPHGLQQRIARRLGVEAPEILSRYFGPDFVSEESESDRSANNDVLD